MFGSIRGPYGVIGTMLGLIALYLVLVNSAGARRLIQSSANGTNTIFRTLQGR